MPSLCVIFTFTVQDLSVHVEEADHPDSLVFADEDEGEPVLPVFQRAWDFISTHTIATINCRLPSALHGERRAAALGGMLWLVQQFIDTQQL